MLSDDDIVARSKPFTMTSEKRLRQTIDTIDYIVKNNIEGDIIEVGVWRGGTVMAMVMKLIQLGVSNRHVHLYDTFEGMTDASEKDVNPQGDMAGPLMEAFPSLKCIASIEEVMYNISCAGYPIEFIHFHKGDIRKVDLNIIPEKIACLRLDIDWYELYKFCLSVFEPHVQPGAPITIDDYGYWSGCKEAVDEYLEDTKEIIKIDGVGVYWYKEKGNCSSI